MYIYSAKNVKIEVRSPVFYKRQIRKDSLMQPSLLHSLWTNFRQYFQKLFCMCNADLAGYIFVHAYILSTAGSAVNNFDSLKKLRSGNLVKWDITTLLWVFLNSGFDGLPADSTEACAGLVSPNGIPVPSHTDADAVSKAYKELAAALRTIRRLRNGGYGHTESWTMTDKEFKKNLKILLEALASIDAFLLLFQRYVYHD